MPGTDLNLDLPTAADTLADMRAKIVTAIEAIEADLAPRVTAGQLDLTTNVSLGGAALTNVGGVRLVGGESTEVGTLYIGSDELKVVTSEGTVQLTLNGAINIVAAGTIGGDYGGVNPAAVVYNDVAGEFRFTEDTGIWADLVADDLKLNGTLGSVSIGVDAALSGAKTVNFKSLPAAGIGGLVYDAANTALVDASLNRETSTHLFTAVDMAGDLNIAGGITMTGTIKHGDHSQSGPIVYPNVVLTLGVVSSNGTKPGITMDASSGVYVYIPAALKSTERVKTITIGFAALTSPATLYIETMDAIATNLMVVQSAVHNLAAFSASIVLTPTAPFVIPANSGLFVKINTPAGSTDVRPNSWKVTYDAIV